MREDEISRYTADSDVLDMMDFRDIPADELEGTEDYIDAQATVAEGIHDALRAATIPHTLLTAGRFPTPGAVLHVMQCQTSSRV